MFRFLAPRVLVATSFILALGVGAGCMGGGPCGSLKPLPTDPQPLGFPTDQLIEGGIQARITAPGFAKLTNAIPRLFESALGMGFCAVKGSQSVLNANICDRYECPMAVQGCPAFVYLDSKDRPAGNLCGNGGQPPCYPPPPPAGDEDGKDGVTVTLNQTSPPTITVHGTFDLLIPMHVLIDWLLTHTDCYATAWSKHLTDDSQTPIDITANIELGTDPTTGELTLHLAQSNPLTVNNFAFDANICGLSRSTPVIGFIVGGIFDFINTLLSSTIGNFIIDLLRPQFDSLLQSLLPKPLGLAGVVDSGTLLAQFEPPKDTNLEMFIVPGGYVQTSGAPGQTGLTIGVMSGLNSDRDETTRTPGLTSEPNECVPARPVPNLAMPPWMLPFNGPRNDYQLAPAGPFSGTPEPMDAMGNLEDVAIGISRTFLDLAGFHLYNSGTLCLHVLGDSIPQLNLGTLSVLVGSLGNIVEDRRAPLALVLRPQQPLTFTIGAGTMADSLVHVSVADMRIDWYGWLEERYVRLFTLSVDINLGVNLTVVKNALGLPALQPMLVGIDASNVHIKVSNTDLLQEKPADLEQLFPALINIATGAIGNVIKPIDLPAVAGFSLDQLSISKVQTSEDDFIGIFATIMDSMPARLVDWSNPDHPALIGEVETQAAVERVDVPSAAELRALFHTDAALAPVARRPTVTLRLGAAGAAGRALEYGWSIDHGMWRPWTRDAAPVIADDAFLLQGHHSIQVRARAVDDWRSMDATPVELDVLIDSIAPELHPALDPNDSSRLKFGGFDIVTPDGQLQYSWVDAAGQRTAWSATDGMPLAEARRITVDGKRKLLLYARDEAGNIAEAAVDLTPMLEFHGRTTNPPTSGGCGSCAVGGAHRQAGSGAALLALALLVFLRRRAAIALSALALVGLGVLAAGCGCEGNGLQCSIDDDCSKLKCDKGEIPLCQVNMCSCQPDLPFGDVGRFSSMTLIGGDAYIAAYNNTYGDLMIGHVTPPGVVTGWDFVDGVPDEDPLVPSSHVRGGVMDNGDDVGRYTSIQVTPQGDPVVGYYDNTHGSLKFAGFGVIRWHAHTVDKGVGAPGADGDDIGRWATMSLAKDGTPGIAYTAIIRAGRTMSGMPEGQLRWAQATKPNPTSSKDWTITIVDSRPLPLPTIAPDGGTTGDGGAGDGGAAPAMMAEPVLPEGIALMSSAARRSDGNPGIAYYDRTRGNLRFVEFTTASGQWSTPIILDGEDMMGNDTGDVGQYPSLVYDGADVAHISYVDATHDNLLYVNTKTMTPEVADDGYRPMDETTRDGLVSPVWHLVGDSSSIQLQPVNGEPLIAYQDSTTVQLRLAQRDQSGKWTSQVIAGHAMPFKGSYGFYASLRITPRSAVISSYAINQQLDTPLFYVEVFEIDLGIIM
jgi:MYXO-CTERM domain-containing protein